MIFIRLRRIVPDRYRGAESALFVAVADIRAFGDRFTDRATGITQRDGGWVQIDELAGESPDGTFAVHQTAEEIRQLIEDAVTPERFAAEVSECP